MYRPKGLEKSGRAKAGAEHNNNLIFSKTYYYSASQIQGFCYYKNLEISKSTWEK